MTRHWKGTPALITMICGSPRQIISYVLQVSVTLRELGLDHPEGYHITDLYDDYDYQIVTPERRFKVDVNPSGSELDFFVLINPEQLQLAT